MTVESHQSRDARRVLPSYLNAEEQVKMKEEIKTKGVALVEQGGEIFIETQGLERLKIGPFDSKEAAKEYAGLV